jgi:hypothetical protein
MKTRIWLALIIAFALVACGKDKFQTVPQLKLKSRNMDIVPVNGTLRLNVEYTDKEGDVSDSIFIVRQRLNVRGPVQLPASPYDIPNFPHTDKGEFEISLTYQFGLVFGLTPLRITGSNPIRNEIDTLRLKIVAKDKAGNKSDTLVVDNIYVTR